MDLLYKDECYKIIGACFEVYNNKGCGFLEPVYQECLQIEFDYQGIPYEAQKELFISYRDHRLRQMYKADFVCYGNIIVEIKAVSKLVDEHRGQVINYLNAAGVKLGLLVNFGHYPQLEWERVIFEKKLLD